MYFCYSYGSLKQKGTIKVTDEIDNELDNQIVTVKENGEDISPISITEEMRRSYLDYAMSVIVSRAIPEIDGFKPAHRKLLYTMYKMGLLKGERQKSANIVGQTMRLNPHGDAAIYETMVRLAKGNETLLHPFVDSKGNTAQFPPYGLSTAPAAAARHLRCQNAR